MGARKPPAPITGLRMGLCVALCTTLALTLAGCVKEGLPVGIDVAQVRASSVCNPDEAPPLCTGREPTKRGRFGALRGGSNRSMDNAPFLPWPPPAPTRMGDISRSLVLKGTLGDVDRQLRARLVSAGYADRTRYFAVPGGFGITTDLERLDSNGAPAPNRWLIGKQGGWTNLFQYLSSLVAGEDGHFRLFAILVTDETVEPASFVVTETDISRWKLSGLPYLNQRRSQAPVLRGTHVWLLVYEFEEARTKGSVVVADREGRFSFVTHARLLGFR